MRLLSPTPACPSHRPLRSSHKGFALDANSTLLRGCVLKNVEYIYGVAVYTGRETKVRVKQSAVLSKKASVESEINRYIIALIITQVVLCLVATIGYAIWNGNLAADSWYLGLPSVNAGDVIARFFTFFLLISNIIPISLYVTMKLARTAQKLFMDADARMVHEDAEIIERSDGEDGVYPLRVRSLDLNDELGQVSHIFSDKTGTLTSNYMEFRKLRCVLGYPPALSGGLRRGARCSPRLRSTYAHTILASPSDFAALTA